MLSGDSDNSTSFKNKPRTSNPGTYFSRCNHAYFKYFSENFSSSIRAFLRTIEKTNCIDIFFRQFRLVKMVAERVVQIFSGRTPFKIIGGIIRFIAINVIDVFFCKFIFVKRFGYDSMQEFCRLFSAAKAYFKVATSSFIWLKKHAPSFLGNNFSAMFKSSKSINRSYSSGRTGFIPWIFNYRFPYFHAVMVTPFLFSCSVIVPNTKFCAVAGLMESGLDCFHTLDDVEEHIEPIAIRNFLESQAEIKDANGKVIQAKHGAAICQPMEDWGAEHTALELACQKLGASCSYDIRKLVDGVQSKVNQLGVEK